MKNIFLKYTLIFSALVLIFTGCEDSLRYPDFQEGVTMRMQFDSEPESFLDFTNLENEDISFTLYTINSDIESVELTAFIDYIDPAKQTEEVEFATVTQAQFDAGNGQVSFRRTAAELAALFGLTIEDLSGGDVIGFTNVTTMNDGRVYPSTSAQGGPNVEPSITQGAGSSFTVEIGALVGCPIPADYFTGNYTFEQLSGPADYFFGGPTLWSSPQSVTLSVGGLIRRTFSGTFLTFTDRPFVIDFICGNVVLPQTASGLACGGAPPWTYGLEQEEILYDAEDFSDDDEVTLSFLDNIQGACGLPTAPITVKLTKD